MKTDFFHGTETIRKEGGRTVENSVLTEEATKKMVMENRKISNL